MDQPKLKSHQPDDSPTQTIGDYTPNQVRMQIIFIIFFFFARAESANRILLLLRSAKDDKIETDSLEVQ